LSLGLTVALALPVALALAGCGGSRVVPQQSKTTPARGPALLNARNADRLIAQQIEAQRHQRVTVSCPRTVPLKAGQQFLCRATLPGNKTVRLLVTETDTQGRLSFQPLVSR
jgi:hypothetical protein